MIIEENDIVHYGVLRRSGRYPWGSGGEEAERTRHQDFLAWVTDLKKTLGWSDAEIAKSVSEPGRRVSSGDIRQLRTIAKHRIKAEQIATAQRLKDKAYSNVAIGAHMGVSESYVRTLLAPGAADKASIHEVTAQALKDQVAEKKYLDVGAGTENYLQVSKERKETAIALLEDEGYAVHTLKVPQVGTGNDTTRLVLVPPGVTYKELYDNRDNVQNISGTFTDDGGRTRYGLQKPLAINPDRVGIRYREDGGHLEDGVIYVRPGVDDVSLGGKSYAQVRVAVGDSHYLKGMAIYKDDLPDGVDLVFNTNKSRTDDKLSVMKPFEKNALGEIDPDNPFGAYISRQIGKDLPDGSKELSSVMNLVREEGDWTRWSKSIASQVLSKQDPQLAKTQLAVTRERRQQEYDEIMALTNPTVKRKLLQEFADGTDAAAVHLKAASLPRQRWQVILPVDDLPETQVYAPNFRQGERVALIRYPHGGTFEIPEVTVNNRHPSSKRLLGNAADAIGINSKTAERLSGADFDGDTVLVIPNNNGQIKHSPALQRLKNFDPKAEYAEYPGMRVMKKTQTQKEMGDISNLINDMTIKNASHDEIAHAVRHSMVVIDAVKHRLDYRRSAADNGIAALKTKYQGGPRAGASTLISLAKSAERVPEIRPRRASAGGPVDKATGKLVFEPTNKTYINARGEVVPVMTRAKKLELTDDAHTLSSGTPIERIYADHSNELKAMANKARLDVINTPRAVRSPSAAVGYADQVASLNAKLDLAYRNKPLERQAQAYANAISRQKVEANPDIKDDRAIRKKIEFQALTEARTRVGAGANNRFRVTPEEWDAIQAGAISDSKLRSILDNADMDSIRELATPRTQLLMSPAYTSRAKQMLGQGFTRAEVAEQLGVSVTTLDTAMEEVG